MVAPFFFLVESSNVCSLYVAVARGFYFIFSRQIRMRGLIEGERKRRDLLTD